MEDDELYNKFRNRNPRENANIFSVLTLFYTFPTFCYGYRKNITEDDLYETFSQHKSSNLGNLAIKLWKRELDNAKIEHKRPSLKSLLIKLFGRQYLLFGFGLAFIELFLKICQALFLGEVISSYPRIDDGHDPRLYAVGFIGSCLAQCIITTPVATGSYHMALKIRVVCSSLIYEKILKLNKSALSQTTPGKIINLLSNDLIIFDKFAFLSQFIWIGPLQTIIVSYFMYREAGISSFFGISLLVLFIPLYFVLGRLQSKFRSRVLGRRDERLGLMDEIIQGINVIKIYAWEKPITKMISQIRNLEIKSVRIANYIKGVNLYYPIFITTSLFITVAMSVIFTQSLNARSLFIITTLSYTLGCTLTYILPGAIAILCEINVSLNRITKFLLCDEIQTTTSESIKGYAVNLTNAFAKWDKESTQNTLSNLNFNIEAGSLAAIIGSVGCGKSSVLQVILAELGLTSGKSSVNGTLSYSSQEPWIFSGSIRQNVLFGSQMNEMRYNNVIKCCALEWDLKLFPYGDRTTVGERGTSLSGGQKARINLARAVYKEADIYLLDDPFSAVDAHVGKQIFEQCLQLFLSGKTVILATHQLHYLKHVNYIVVLDNGSLKTKGTTAELEKSGCEFTTYLTQDDENAIENYESTSTRSQDEQRLVKKSNNAEVCQNTGFISFSTYKDYFLASKNYLLVVISLSSLILAQVTFSASYCFIAYWVNMEQSGKFSNKERQRELYIYIYCGITAATVFSTILGSVSFVSLTIGSSKTLHSSMFDNLVHATLSFFSLSSSGQILNRFSKDLSMIDEHLPQIILVAGSTLLQMLGVVGIICFVNPWFLIPTIALSILLYYIRKFYITTNLNILRVEGIVRSPLYGHVNASLQGLTTIRAFGVQDILTKEFYQHQDSYSTAVHMGLTTARAFAFWMDLISFIYIATLTLYYTFGKESYGGNIGLVISQSLQLVGQLQWSLRLVTEVENNMISVERVLEYMVIERERHTESLPNQKPPLAWPHRGQITFEQVFLKYSHADPYVLKNLNFTFQPLEKVGIVGRTGAGKSSIISALFQLTDFEGSIIIDGINVKNIGLHDLRKKMSIIPQDPVLFSGTLRNNLDPLNEYDDDVLWKALEEVRLKALVDNLRSGLKSKISQDGTNFSVGQRQLLCLARAVVRNNKILVLDEATANVDFETDNIIQETIRRKFSNCTVLTIAHRLNTITDSDKILVMDDGEVVEFDHPHVLLENKSGKFYDMVQQTEKAIADRLTSIVQENYKQNAGQLGFPLNKSVTNNL